LFRSLLKPVILPGAKTKDHASADGTLEVECWHDIACGNDHTAGVTPTGELYYAWGLGDDGQLGHGNHDDDLDKSKLVECLIGKKVVRVSCGACHTAVVTTDGDLYTWYVYSRNSN
jgi:alpha-tubulin suppressor-like RCC1 family protein